MVFALVFKCIPVCQILLFLQLVFSYTVAFSHLLTSCPSFSTVPWKTLQFSDHERSLRCQSSRRVLEIQLRFQLGFSG